MDKTLPVQRPESEGRIADMFDRIAPRYDFLNRLLSGWQDQRWRKVQVGRIPAASGGTLLDVATGTGDVLLAAAKARKEYSHYIGVDISDGMLDLARTKAQTQMPGRDISFRNMSAEALSLSDRSVDAITISFGLRNVVNRDQALAEFARVLKPGGSLLILEFFLPEGGFWGRLFQFYFHQILPRVGGLFSDKQAYTYLPQSVGSFYKPAALRSALKEAGLLFRAERRFLFGATRLVIAERTPGFEPRPAVK